MNADFENSADIYVKPEVTLLEDVLKEIGAGSIRVPKFQRPFVWSPQKMLQLFDSIERGFPIGSLLLWQTDESVDHVTEIGGIPVPSGPTSSATTYVLDGHQRLSTLYGTLRRPTDDKRGRPEEWMWSIYRDLNHMDPHTAGFAHWKSTHEYPPPWLLPMNSVLRTMDFLRFARDLESALPDSQLLDLQIDRAELVAQRLKSYKISVIRLIGGSLEQAVEVFSRLNSSGSPISADQMVSALTYHGGESLGDRISTIQDELATRGFADVESKVIFRAVLAAADEEDILNTRWEVLARRLEGELSSAADRAQASLAEAVEFLKTEVGVTRSRLLPYSIQLVLLATFFAYVDDFTAAKRVELRRWFWMTSWAGHFAGANTTQVKLDLQRMKEFARSETPTLIDGTLSARPFPERFDLRSARIRCFLAWFFREFESPYDYQGRPFVPMHLLDEADARAFRQIATERVEGSSSPANRVMLPTPAGVSAKSTLLRMLEEHGPGSLLSLGIPDDSIAALVADDDEEFIARRAQYLSVLESRFMAEFGVEVAATGRGPEFDVE